MKTLVPDSHDDVIMFIQRLVSVGVNLNGYRKAYKEDNEEVLVTIRMRNKIN